VTPYLLVRNHAPGEHHDPEILAVPAQGLAERLQRILAVVGTARSQDLGLAEYQTGFALYLPAAEGDLAADGEVWLDVVEGEHLVIWEAPDALTDAVRIEGEHLAVGGSGHLCFRYSHRGGDATGQSDWIEPEALLAVLAEAGLGSGSGDRP
jgi:hypothetical protein